MCTAQRKLLSMVVCVHPSPQTSRRPRYQRMLSIRSLKAGSLSIIATREAPGTTSQAGELGPHKGPHLLNFWLSANNGLCPAKGFVLSAGGGVWLLGCSGASGRSLEWVKRCGAAFYHPHCLLMAHFSEMSSFRPVVAIHRL